jgi:hypothetical protein
MVRCATLSRAEKLEVCVGTRSTFRHIKAQLTFDPFARVKTYEDKLSIRHNLNLLNAGLDDYKDTKREQTILANWLRTLIATLARK